VLFTHNKPKVSSPFNFIDAGTKFKYYRYRRQVRAIELDLTCKKKMLKVQKQRESGEYDAIKIPSAEEAQKQAQLVKALNNDQLDKKVNKSLVMLKRGVATAIKNTDPTPDGRYTIVVNSRDIYYKRKEVIFAHLEEELRKQGYTMHQREEYRDWFNKEIFITFQWILPEDVPEKKKKKSKSGESSVSRR
jgi:hypothetical protein